MAHIRQRHVQGVYEKLLKFSPIIGLFGHRQVGKSTFTAESAGTYWTLDDRDTRELIKAGPKRFLRSQVNPPTVIDECQFEPELFPALKEHVRTHKRPGQFVLTGSVRFTSRKAIRESLAGRITQVELLPLVLSELMQKPLSDSLPQLLRLPSFAESSLGLLNPSAKSKTVQKYLEKYLLNGGLPGLCFIREERLRRDALASLHNLILDRDMRLVATTRLSLETLTSWLRWIATNGWNSYNAAEVTRVLGLSSVTQKNLLYALESIFLIRRIPIQGRAGAILLLEDQYEELVLSENRLSRSDQVLSAFFRNARAQFQYLLGDTTHYGSFWTRSNARIPLVIANESGALGFSVIERDQPTLSQKRAADSFLRHYAHGKIVFLCDQVIPARVLDPRVLLCSASAVL